MRFAIIWAAALGGLLLGAGGVWAGDSTRVEFTIDVTPHSARRGQTVIWKMTTNILPQYHSYPLQQPPDSKDPSLITDLVVPKFGPFVFVGSPTGPPGGALEDIEGTKASAIRGHGKWEWRFVVHPDAEPGKYTVPLHVLMTACDDQNCAQVSAPTVEFEILGDPPVPVEDKYRSTVAEFPIKERPKPVKNPDNQVKVGNEAGGAVAPPAVGVVSPGQPKKPEIVPPADSFEEHEANLKSVKAQLVISEKLTDRGSGGLWGFVLAAIFWGMVALVTPCVFPMIPITVSFFLHQSEHEHHRPIKMALIYCGTIIIVLGVAALTLLAVFRELSVHPIMNIAMGALFVFFALSLFGMYEITLPSKLTAFTSSREGGGGVAGTMFMALTFTIVSFTCVAPFLGGFSGMAASGQFSKFELFVGAMVFSTTFAAPFFLLALFPSMIKKLPQSGSWLNSVKVVMGFLELAACLKFFRTAELRLLPHTEYFTYDLVLGIWIALAVISGLYLLNVFRLHHDEPIEHIGVVRMLIGLIFISLGVYFLPAIFKNSKGENQRPAGVVYSWVDSFLLPEPGEEDLPWSANLKGTIDAARADLALTGAKRQFILLDCTGVTCTNCKYNERTVFTRPDVHELLLKFRLVQHYTDTVPEAFFPQGADKERRVNEAQANLAFQRDPEIFGTEQLPLYAVMEVTRDKVLMRGVYDEAKINNPAAFIKFLNDARN